MSRHIKTQTKDSGFVINEAQSLDTKVTEHELRRKKAISMSPNLSKKVPVSIPEIRAVIFINPGEDPVAAVQKYMNTQKQSLNTSKKKNGEFLEVES